MKFIVLLVVVVVGGINHLLLKLQEAALVLGLLDK